MQNDGRGCPLGDSLMFRLFCFVWHQSDDNVCPPQVRLGLFGIGQQRRSKSQFTGAATVWRHNWNSYRYYLGKNYDSECLELNKTTLEQLHIVFPLMQQSMITPFKK